jgi:hypothetical protein
MSTNALSSKWRSALNTVPCLLKALTNLASGAGVEPTMHQSSFSRTRPVAREPGAAAGWVVQLTLRKPTTLLKWLRL